MGVACAFLAAAFLRWCNARGGRVCFSCCCIFEVVNNPCLLTPLAAEWPRSLVSPPVGSVVAPASQRELLYLFERVSKRYAQVLNFFIRGLRKLLARGGREERGRSPPLERAEARAKAPEQSFGSRSGSRRRVSRRLTCTASRKHATTYRMSGGART